jgi:hypothetical protein
MWWPKVTGWAVCKWVKPGMMVAASRSASSTSPCCRRVISASDGIDLIAQVQAHIGGDLVVARAAGVQFLAGDADALGQARLDVHVHVLELDAPLEAALLDLAADLAEARDDRRRAPERSAARRGRASRRGPASRGCRAARGGGRSPPRR